MARGACLRVPGLLLALGASGAVEPTPGAAGPAAPPAAGIEQAAARDEHDFLAALAQAPQVRALIERRLSARHLEGAAGRLPDPQLMLGYARKRATSEDWPMYDLALEQPLPRWGERDAARAMAAAQTRLSDAQIASEVGLLAADLALALAEIAGARAQLTEGEAQVGRIDALGRAIDARVASGEAGAPERLAIETRRERLQLRLETVRRSIADQDAQIRGRLGLTATAALPPFVAPAPAAVAASRTPAMIEAEAQRQDALAALQAARALRHPESAIGIRAEREALAMGNEDTIGVTVRISLPVARGALEAGEEAAQARVRAAVLQGESARWRTTAAVESAQRAITLAQRAAQLATGLLARAEAEQPTLTSALASGTGRIEPLLDLSDRLADLRLEVIAATVAARQAQAALWLLVLPELPRPTGAGP